MAGNYRASWELPLLPLPLFVWLGTVLKSLFVRLFMGTVW